MSVESATHLQRDVNALTVLERRHYIAGHERNEDDVTHSYSVAMLAWRLHSEYGSYLSLQTILQLSLVHDAPEQHAGDVNTFASPEARAQKVIDERAAIERMKHDYANWPDYIAMIEEYEARETEEAQFAWSCDKMQALIQGLLDHWRPYNEVGITYEMFVAKLEEFRPQIHHTLVPFFDELAAQCRATYRLPRE